MSFLATFISENIKPLLPLPGTSGLTKQCNWLTDPS